MGAVAAGFITDVFKGTAGGFSFMCHMIPYCDVLIIGFKVVILLFLIGWVKNHLGGGIISTVVMLFMGYFVLFEYFFVFGPLAIVYIAALVGATGLMMDFVFTKHHYMPGSRGMGGAAGRMMAGGEPEHRASVRGGKFAGRGGFGGGH